MFSLNNKVALVTGGASGVGFEVAKRFAAAGASVAIADLADADGVAAGHDMLFVRMDVADAESVVAGMDSVVSRLGKLDVLVNNAGIGGEDGVTIEDSDEQLTRRLFEINTLGVLNGLKFGPARMNDGASIINTASLGATVMFPGSGPYSASKASVITLTQMSALELANRKIRVNAVAPSFIRTPMAAKDIALFERVGETSTAAQRIAEPDEVAAVFHFLAADDASYVNGQVINVDGGMSLGFTNEQLAMLSA
jgi:NAD(P)-dependent dehydrogenase (short-subunit alcohol dehydrogenase family)